MVLETAVTSLQTANPIPFGVVAEEAQRIVYTLHDMRPDGRGTRHKAMLRLSLSDEMLRDATSDTIADLVAELPYRISYCWNEGAGDSGEEKPHIFIPCAVKDAFTGVGLSPAQKRYRDVNGVLTIPLSEVEKLTRAEADAYYVNGGLYVYKGMMFTYTRSWTKMADGTAVEDARFSHGVYNNFMDPDSLGTFLPDVASVGNEIVSVSDKRFQPLPCLTKSLKKFVMGCLKED